MIPRELVEALEPVPDVVLRPSEPLGRHLPLRVGGPAAFCWVSTYDAMVEVLRLARKHTVSWRTVWPFQELVVKDGGVPGLVIRPCGEFERVWRAGEVVWVGSAALWSLAGPYLEARGQGAIARWPGCPGALLDGSERGLLKGLLVAVQRISRGRVETAETEVAPDMAGTSTVLVAVGLRPGRVKRHLPPLGALFSDPDHDTAARVLTKSSVLGTRLRDWRLSPNEPGTLVQLGDGSAEDLALLIKGIQTQVDKSRGIKLEARIPIIGQRSEGAGRKR